MTSTAFDLGQQLFCTNRGGKGIDVNQTDAEGADSHHTPRTKSTLLLKIMVCVLGPCEIFWAGTLVAHAHGQMQLHDLNRE